MRCATSRAAAQPLPALGELGVVIATGTAEARSFERSQPLHVLVPLTKCIRIHDHLDVALSGAAREANEVEAIHGEGCESGDFDKLLAQWRSNRHSTHLGATKREDARLFDYLLLHELRHGARDKR